VTVRLYVNGPRKRRRGRFNSVATRSAAYEGTVITTRARDFGAPAPCFGPATLLRGAAVTNAPQQSTVTPCDGRSPPDGRSARESPVTYAAPVRSSAVFTASIRIFGFLCSSVDQHGFHCVPTAFPSWLHNPVRISAATVTVLRSFRSRIPFSRIRHFRRFQIFVLSHLPVAFWVFVRGLFPVSVAVRLLLLLYS